MLLLLKRLEKRDNILDVCREAAVHVFALTRFDRVMVYKFDEQGSGEVIAESKRTPIESYLGLHYPASDIPAQARKLYLKNIIRIIADVDAETVPIVPTLDPFGRPLDMSLCVTRSVSPIHIEYLKNMGVKASMSISIIRDGKLWGLFACHHYEKIRVIV